MGCSFFWWTWLCLWEFLCALWFHWPNAQIHLLRTCSNSSCTWDLASADHNWVIGLSVYFWLLCTNVRLFLSFWVFVLSIWGVYCCGAVPRPPHSLIALSCCGWLVWRVLIGTFFCWILCWVCFFCLLRPMFLCVIACCGPLHCCWPSVWFRCVVFYALCVLLMSDCWVESCVVLSLSSYPPSELLWGAPSELVGCP